MKTFGLIALFTAVLYTLQASLLPMLAYHSISPDLMLLATTSAAFLYGRRIGALAGFLLGLVVDMATGTYFGVHAFTYILVGYVIGRFSSVVFEEQFFLPVFSSIFVTVADYFILLLLMLLLGYRFQIVSQMEHTLVAMLVCQLVFSYPVHYAVCWLDRRIRRLK